jgi:hypothetical protein
MNRVVAALIIPLLTFVGTVMSAYFAWDAQRKVGTLDAEIKARAEARLAEESARSFQLQIYTILTDSLNKPSAYQEAARALINAALAGDLKESFLLVLASSDKVDEQVAQRARENVFDSAQAAAPTPPEKKSGVLAGINIDVFWCESGGESGRDTASGLVESLRSEGVGERLRLRMLPDSVNARAGYGVKGLIIRHDDGEEEDAKLLQERAAQLSNLQFNLGRSRQETARYLSLFVCSDA